MFFRKHDLFTNPQFYAEDGVVLFTEAYYDGCSSITSSYAGYQILYQRLVACTGLFVPLEHVPLFYLLGTLAALAWVVFCVFDSRVPLPFKIFAGLAPVLSPVQNEVFFGPTNSQWVLALILVLLLISDAPKTMLQVGRDLILLSLVGLSGPYCLVFSPVFLLRSLWYRDRWSVIMLGLILILSVVQTWEMEKILRVPGGGGTPLDFARVLAVYFVSLFASSYADIDPTQTSLIWGVTALAVVFYGAAGLFALHRRDWPMLVCVLVGPLIIGSALYAFRSSPSVMIGSSFRYWFIPTVTLFWLLLLFSKYHPKSAFLLLGAMCLNVILNFSYYQGPYFKDMNWKKWSPCVESKAPACIIPHPPDNWQIIICKVKGACDDLIGGTKE
jgi:hypothetical protein